MSLTAVRLADTIESEVLMNNVVRSNYLMETSSRGGPSFSTRATFTVTAGRFRSLRNSGRSVTVEAQTVTFAIWAPHT